MCIRDSLDGEAELLEGPRRNGDIVDRRRDDLEDRALEDHCLLYTSDAADDLLRVDLGGRRIIKKKKKHHHTPATLQNHKHHPQHQPHTPIFTYP